MICRKMEKGRDKKTTSKAWAERKGFTLVMEELKQGITAKTTTVKRDMTTE